MTDYIAIPEVFYSFAGGEPFQSCTVCSKNLLVNDTQYIIEKAIRQYPGYSAQDIIFEYALCLPCLSRMRNEVSPDSAQIITDYFNSAVDLPGRREKLIREAGLQVEKWISHCLITGVPSGNIAEYHLYAHCDGGDLLFSYLPYMISRDAVEQISLMLSSETKDIINGFIDQHFSFPPHLKELLKKHNSLIT